MIRLPKSATLSLLVLEGVALMPWAPSFRPDYCEQQPHWAFANHWRYGSDIVFHSGPLGFLGSPLYNPSTYPALFVAHLLGLLISVFVLREMSRRVFGPTNDEWLHVAGVLFPLCLTPVSYYSPLLTLPVVLVIALLLLHFGSTDNWNGPLKYALVSALGFSVLIKSSLGLPLFVGVLCISIDEMRRKRRVPVSLLVFCASVGAGWILGRQSISAIPIYLHFTSEFVAGYRDAASLWSAWSSALALLTGVSVLFAIAALYPSAKQKFGRGAALQLVAVWSLISYGIFLHGFVRADREHTVHEVLALIAVATVIAPWLIGARHASLAQWLTRAAFGATFTFCLIEAIAGHVGFGRLLATGPRDLVRLLREGPDGLRSDYRAELMRLQAEGAKLDLRGPADMAAGSPTNPGILLIKPGFRPRPTVVSYAAWTPDLIELNRRYLEDSNGPSSVLFQPPSIDNLYPTLTDSAAFISLATHYRVRAASLSPLILERKERPSGARLSVVDKQRVRLDQAIDLGAFGDSPIWVSILLRPNAVGKAIGLAFKPLPVALDVMVEGKWIRKRLATKLAANGMLLSPYLETAADFREFYLNPSNSPQSKRVQRISIPSNADPPFSARLWLQDDIDVVLQSVIFES